MVLEEKLDAALERYQRRVIDVAMASNENDDRLTAFFEGQIAEWDVVADSLVEPPMGYTSADAAQIVVMLEGAIQACRKPA